MGLCTLLSLCLAALHGPPLHHLWMEAETFGSLRGANFSFMKAEQQTRGSWAIAGPDAAAAWTQGGESEFMSIAARADEPNEIGVGRELEIPAAGVYTLWVRYADYREKREEFGVRVIQGGRAVFSHEFGKYAVVDELDPMKLLWDWAYGWETAPATLAKGPARVEIYTTGPTQARRCLDCLCLTTDPDYRPSGREKPDFAALKTLRELAENGVGSAPPLASRTAPFKIPDSWNIAAGPPAFLWNAGQPWLDELAKPAAARVDAPFGIDPPLLKEFTDAFRGKAPPVYGHPLSGPAIHIPLYPAAFAKVSPVLDWLDRHPDQKFAILLNYGEPSWPQGADKAAVLANLRRYGNQFVGYVAGENIAYAPVDTPALETAVKSASSRRDVLDRLKHFHTAAAIKKFSEYAGAPLAASDAWGPDISCLSASMEAWAHAICDWGARQIGHENTGNSPTLARRLAFLRGACRQFGAKLIDYQSCNLGDSATIFAREHYFYPASSRYILDNSYDAWAGAGVNWLLKDYVLWHLAGASAFYHEQGVDTFWKPGGGVAGDDNPIQLSPKGKVAEKALRIATKPRGTQFTPIAFLLDEAHGYTQERFSPGAFGLDPALNPAVLAPGRHEAAIRGWFDVAYYPAPVTQGEPATAIRQTYVNGIFGDNFDVIVNAPGRTRILDSYPVVILAGEVHVTAEWGAALRDYVRNGGTLVVSGDQVSGPGARDLSLPPNAPRQEAGAFLWSTGREPIPSNTFRFNLLKPGRDQVLASTPDGDPIAISRRAGKGQLIYVAIPLGLGIDEQPAALLPLLLQGLVAGQVPIDVKGDVEWILNRLEDGGWLLTLLNNRGVLKPAHGVNPTDYREAQTVTIRAPFAVRASEEWMTEQPVAWQNAGGKSLLTLTVPAGAVRMIQLNPR